MAEVRECSGVGDSESLPNRVRGPDSRYLSTLTSQDRKRFEEKLKVVVGNVLVEVRSPYETWSAPNIWREDPSSWPEIGFGDVWNYLINTPGPFTADKLKAYKSLEAHEYFVSRKVGCVYSREIEKSGVCVQVLKAEVRPGQAESQNSYFAWMIVKKDGQILTAHCDCKAGLGETCSHAASIMFKVEAAVRIGLTTTACTSEACRWNRVFGNNSLTAPVDEIDFKPAQKGESVPRSPAQKNDGTPLACMKGGADYMIAYQGYLDQLKDICPTACVFKSLPKIDPEETDTADSDENESEKEGGDEASIQDSQENSFEITLFPAPLAEAAVHTTLPVGPPPFPFNGEKLEQWEKIPEQLSSKQLGYLRLLEVSYERASQLEQETKKQADCPKWHQLRFPRLTASKFGTICSKMEKPRAKPGLVARDLLQPKSHSSFVEKMFKWGRDNEHVAIQVYISIPPKSHVVTYESGIFISPEDPYLAATPDRICYDPKEAHPWGIIEVKCPYHAREMSPVEAANKVKNFMSSLQDDGTLALNINHDYYLQVQGQMALTGAAWCDFVIYTKKGISVQRIPFEKQFWESKARLLSRFFLQYFLPKFIELKEHPQS